MTAKFGRYLAALKEPFSNRWCVLYESPDRKDRIVTEGTKAEVVAVIAALNSVMAVAKRMRR